MKTVTIYRIESNTFDRSGWLIHGDNHYFFDVEKAKRQFNDCCCHDEVDRHGDQKYAVCMAEHTIRLPDDYEIKTAEKIDEDMSNGVVESPDYDSRVGIYKSTSIKLLKKLHWGKEEYHD